MRLQITLIHAILFCTLVLLIGCDKSPDIIGCPDVDDLVTVRVGRTPGGSLYSLESILIRYETDTRLKAGLTNRPPADAVRDFFAKKGYTATVVGYTPSYEVVFIDGELDMYSIWDDLNGLPGVADPSLHFLHRMSEMLDTKAEYTVLNGDSSPGKHAIIEVGMLEDGTLYEFGTILIQYADKHHTGAQEVNDFFTQRYYTPTITAYLASTGHYVMYIGNCFDPAPVIEPLSAISGVKHVGLNKMCPTFSLQGRCYDRW